MQFRFRALFLAAPIVLLGVALWRVQEAQSYLPRDYNFPAPYSFDAQPLPLAWRGDSIWMCGLEGSEGGQEKRLPPPAKETPFKIGTRQTVKLRPTTRYYSSNGLSVAVSENGTIARTTFNSPLIEIWRDGKMTRSFSEKPVPNHIPKGWNKDNDGWQHPGQLQQIAISPDGSRVASTSNLYGYHNSEQIERGFSPLGFVLFDARRGRQITRISADESNFTALTFSPDNRNLAALSLDGWLFLLDAQTGKIRRKWRAHRFLAGALAFSPDGKTLVSATNNRPPHYSFHFRRGPQAGVGIGGGFSPGSSSKQTFGEGKNSLVITTDAQTGHLRFSTHSKEQTLKFWDVQTGKQRGQTVAFADDAHNIVWRENQIAVGGVGKITLLDARTGTTQSVFSFWNEKQALGQNEKSVAVWAELSPDSRFLALGTTKRIRVFRLN